MGRQRWTMLLVNGHMLRGPCWWIDIDVNSDQLWRFCISFLFCFSRFFLEVGEFGVHS